MKYTSLYVTESLSDPVCIQLKPAFAAGAMPLGGLEQICDYTSICDNEILHLCVPPGRENRYRDVHGQAILCSSRACGQLKGVVWPVKAHDGFVPSYVQCILLENLMNSSARPVDSQLLT